MLPSVSIGPTTPHSDGNGKGDIELDHVFHLRSDELFHLRGLILFNLTEQFVMYLQDEPGLKPPLSDGPMDVYHRHFDDVRRRALYGGVHGHSLTKLSHGGVAIGKLRYEAHPSEESPDEAGGAGLFDDAVHEGPYRPVPVEITVDILLCLPLADAQFLCQAEGAHAIYDAEIDDLCRAAHVLGDEVGGYPKDIPGYDGMDVIIPVKSFDQFLIPGKVGKDPKFDLGVVGRKKEKTVSRHEGFANPRPFFSPYRDVLEIRIAAGEPSRRRHHLIEGGMYPPCVGIDEGG